MQYLIYVWYYLTCIASWITKTIIKYYINIIHIYNVTQTPTCLILYLCKVRHGIIAALISGGGGPPSKICPHGFNFRATLLCFEDFFEKKSFKSCNNKELFD